MQVPQEKLTPREMVVLDLLRTGLTNKQIARSIAISEQTVKYHLKNIYGKLGALGRAHAVAIAEQTRSEAAGEPATEDGTALVAAAGGSLSPLAFARRARRLYAQRPAVEEHGRSWTYADFLDRCDRAAALLASLGVRHGDRVAVLAPNCMALLEQFYAVPQLGAVLVPLNERFGAEECVGVVMHCEARVLCATQRDAADLDDLRDRLPGVAWVLLDGERTGWIDYQAALRVSAPVAPASAIHDDDPITINYTSGTGAHPKGVVISHRNAWVNSLGSLLHWPLQTDDRFLWNLPMFHANGWGFVWTVTAAGATHVMASGIEPEDLAQRVDRDRITALCAGRTTLAGLRALQGPSTPRVGAPPRALFAAAAPSAALIEHVETQWGWDITHAYGMSEAAPFLTVCVCLPEHRHLDARARYRVKARQGVPMLTVDELRVVDEEGQDVPADGTTLGEIVARGPMVMKGYYRDPQATARALAGGYLHTGDAAVMHRDGYIEIRDRFKDIIISGDEIISSVEIEEVIAQHAQVQDVAVVGRHDDVLGERALAYVQLKAGSRTTTDALLAYAAERLTGLRVPAAVHFVDLLPRTATGKIRKYRLRGDLTADPSG